MVIHEPIPFHQANSPVHSWTDMVP
jgi:hypothetical protein